ncbi:hypothetical protein LCGC14_1189210, partial [marine sediment metagenome]
VTPKTTPFVTLLHASLATRASVKSTAGTSQARVPRPVRGKYPPYPLTAGINAPSSAELRSAEGPTALPAVPSGFASRLMLRALLALCQLTRQPQPAKFAVRGPSSPQSCQNCFRLTKVTRHHSAGSLLRLGRHTLAAWSFRGRKHGRTEKTDFRQASSLHAFGREENTILKRFFSAGKRPGCSGLILLTLRSRFARKSVHFVLNPTTLVIFPCYSRC